MMFGILILDKESPYYAELALSTFFKSEEEANRWLSERLYPDWWKIVRITPTVCKAFRKNRFAKFEELI